MPPIFATTQLIVFMVPKVPLVYQQAEAIKAQTKLRVKTFVGDDGVDFWKTEKWSEELEHADVIVLTAQVSRV